MSKAGDAQQLERLTFFSDAVFAIAMTLLVIEIRVPHLEALTEQALAQGLANLIPNYIGFVVSFVVIARFWIGHHRTFGLLRATDRRLVVANVALLMAIAFMPFPTAVLSDYVQLKTAVGFYTGWLVVVGIANLVLIRSALGDGHLLAPHADPAAVRQALRSVWVPIAIGGLGFVAGMIAPIFALGVLILGTPVAGWIARRSA